MSSTQKTISCLNGYLRENTDIEAGYYIHKQKLGEGGFSKVRLGTHLLTGEKVAIKCMDKNKLGEDLFRIKTEISALKKLDHPFISKLLQVIETDQKIYLILEYCNGGELFDYIVAKSRLSEKESKQIMSSLIQVLAYLHSHGFAHRDLKPENILFDKFHRIKLIDFGLAAQSKDHNSSIQYLKTCCGSPAYAAPELVSGEIYSGPAIDVWSAGVILYTLLVGQLPFDDENMTNLYRKIQAGKYTTPSWLSSESKAIMASMLQVDPKKRITVKELLKHSWLKDYISNEVVFQKNIIDEEILWQVHSYFPTVNFSELRYNIVEKFGYQTATYWLLKEKKNFLNLYLASKKIDVKPSKNTSITKPFVSTKSPEIPLKEAPAVSLKRKIVDPPSLVSTFKSTPPKVARPNITVNENKGNTSSKIPVHLKTPIKSTLPPKSPLSPSSNLQTPATPLAKRRKLLDGIVSGTAKQVSVDLNSKENFKTPNKVTISCQTPKKSLLKKLLESATPSLHKGPRNITSSALSTTKNITLTKFKDPQTCIDSVLDSLSRKGIECKQKGYMIKCALNNKFQNVLTFNLEICILGHHCAIQRKRLKGDAWNYKKICEEILRISNELST